MNSLLSRVSTRGQCKLCPACPSRARSLLHGPHAASRYTAYQDWRNGVGERMADRSSTLDSLDCASPLSDATDGERDVSLRKLVVDMSDLAASEE